MDKFIELEHMADVKYKMFAHSLNKIFEYTALAFSSYVASGSKIKPNKIKKIVLSADNKETLLYKFIDELIYLIDAESFVVSKAKVNIEKNSLKASLIGDDTSGYSLKHVKAATYAEMYIKDKGKDWEAQVVLDV